MDDYEQIYTKIFDNLEEMDKFIGTYDSPRLNEEETESLNGPITNKEIELVNKKNSYRENTKNTWFHS